MKLKHLNEFRAETPTIVVFRKYDDGQIIALFPESSEGHGMVNSYMHLGQHGAADYDGVINDTVPATPSEYASLKRELESAPYYYKLLVH